MDSEISFILEQSNTHNEGMVQNEFRWSSSYDESIMFAGFHHLTEEMVVECTPTSVREERAVSSAGLAVGNSQSEERAKQSTKDVGDTQCTDTGIYSSKRPYICDMCQKAFVRFHDLKVHIRIHTGECPFVCNVCYRKFTHGSTLSNHMRTHSGERPYTCNECQKQFKQPGHLRAHMSTVHGEKSFHKCDGCSRTFTEITALQRHMRTHSLEPVHECAECHKKFPFASTLRAHVRIHTGERPHECDQCHKRFTQLGAMRKHMRIHSGERPYECNICHKKFIEASHLHSHVKIHTGERPHECTECHRKFLHVSAFRKHMRLHSGGCPYKCDKCNKGFTEIGALQQHAKIHSDEGIHECADCHKKFAYISSFQKHVTLQLCKPSSVRARGCKGSQKQYQCAECHKKYTHISSLRKHVKIHFDTQPRQKFERSRVSRTDTSEEPLTQDGVSGLNKRRKHSESCTLQVETRSRRALHECNECHKKFPYISTLRTHIEMHKKPEDSGKASETCDSPLQLVIPMTPDVLLV